MDSENETSSKRMYDIIAASFFQKKTCVLPGIGRLAFTSKPSEGDFSNSQLLPPRQSIVFLPATDKNDLPFNEFSAISELMKKTLETEGEVTVTGIGRFTKQPQGELSFKAIELDPVFQQPVEAIRVVRQNAEHNILVGDNQVTNTVMNERLHVAEEKNYVESKWWIWAIVWLVTATALLVYYFYNTGFNNLGAG